MGRRSSGGGGFRSAPRVKTPAPKPATKASAPPPAPAGGAPTSIVGSIGSAIADGIGWGVGTSMAHRAIDSILGPRTIRVEVNDSQAAAATSATQAAPLDACSIHNKAFGDCINQNGSDISRCQFYLDMLNECRRVLHCLNYIRATLARNDTCL